MLQRIYLVGFMGAGKSTVGRELALRLRWPFFDLDSEIERVEKQSVSGIFAHLGEPCFRQLEREHLVRLSQTPQAVIALGGGAYVDPENRKVVDNTGVAVWLDVSFPVIRERIRMTATRPLFADPERAARLYSERLPFYRLARIHVLTDNRLPDAIAAEILKKVGEL